jgi:AmiR/NasT family two-component response regulator
MPEEEKAALKEELRKLKERLEGEKAVKRNVDSLLYKLEVSLSRCR